MVNGERAESREREKKCVWAGEAGSKTGWVTRGHISVKGWNGRGTCWALAWFWRSIWNRAAERAGLASRGIVGAAPRRPGHKEHVRTHSTRTKPIIYIFLRICEFVTLFVCLWQRVEQHLEGGRVVEACKYLHSCGIREETFSPVHSLGGRGHETDDHYREISNGLLDMWMLVRLSQVPWFGQQSEQPTCFFQEGQGHRRTPWCVSQPAAGHQWVAVPPQPCQLWQTPEPQTAESFHLVPEPTVEAKKKKKPFKFHGQMISFHINKYTRLSDRPEVTAWTIIYPDMPCLKSTFTFKNKKAQMYQNHC